jgi:Carboxypeptidase regulatory-like domain
MKRHRRAATVLGAFAVSIALAGTLPAAGHADIKVWCDWCDEEDDPAGVVYDVSEYAEAIAAGRSADQARRDAAVAGAHVVLQRASGDGWISPPDGPQHTAADGRFRWLVPPGDYRVTVSRTGYRTTVSRTVHIPPAVTDLHVALERRPAGDAKEAALLLPVALGAGLVVVRRRRTRRSS